MATDTKIYEGHLKTGACKVYITPDSTYVGYISVAVLYAKSSTGSFASGSDVLKSYDLKQTLTKTEEEAIQWASQWLRVTFGTDPNLKEVAG